MLHKIIFIIIVIIAALYIISPIDLIPDFIPLIGFMDDIAVLTTIISALQGELVKYRNWKR